MVALDDIGGNARQARMKVLARASGEDLAAAWRQLGVDPAFQNLRGPETGLVTVRGRIGGDGDAFNFGDVTVTRASVRLENGETGHAYRLGRDSAAAQLCAVIDALTADTETARRVDDLITRPLQSKQQANDTRRRSETEATRVDFFTMVRGED